MKKYILVLMFLCLPLGVVGQTSSKCIFTRDLKLGSRGDDVECLQKILNAGGYQIAASGPGSPGNETTTFGPATKVAVMKWQATAGVSPASGYFGTLSQAKYNSMIVTTTPTSTVVPPIQQQNIDMATIVAEWKNRIAEVTCSWNYANGGTVYQTVRASGLLINFTGLGTTLITNKHVVVDVNGYVANHCLVGVYGKGARLIDYDINKDPFVVGVDRDWAYIKLGREYALSTNSDGGNFDTITSKNLNVCTNQVNIGDKLIVLGYPTIGAQGGITVTDGIVSGLEGDFYVTSAKIDHGNSGGAAILLKDDCYLGIPTWVERQQGGFESLGRILKSSFVFGN